MKSRTDLTEYQPQLPGTAPGADAATELLQTFTVWDEGRDVIAARLPSAAERRVLASRLETLDRGLRAFWDDAGDKRAVRDALVLFFNGYPSLRNADAPAMVTAYMVDLKSLPAYAVRQALDDIKHGRVRDVDHRSGREIPLDPDWPPSSPRVYDVAVKIIRAPVGEQVKIRKLFAAKPARAELSSEERATAGAKIRAMADAAKRQFAVPDAATLALNRQAEERREEAQRRREAQLAADYLDEYAELGVEPVKIGGVMISPELAQRINPGLFSGRVKP